MAASLSHSILLKGGTVLVLDDQDSVQGLKNTDILVQNNRIAKIGVDLAAPADAELVDCAGKIISPGFVDTHHHLWQTQLKGSHADQSVFDYIPTGYWQSHVFTPEDMYWGQLGGALEAIDSGTTFVVDHAHGNRTDEHANQALAATIASGIRSIFAYSHSPYFDRWDSESCEISRDILPSSSIEHVIRLATQQPYGQGRVNIGFGFDYWFLPKEVIVGLFGKLRKAGVKLFTAHYAHNATFGSTPIISILYNYGLLQPSNDVLLSHATNLTAKEKAELVKSQVPVSSTPDTEAQMGFGWPVAFEPGINTTIGVDCHSNNTSSILSLARAALQMARQKESVADLEGVGSGCMHLQPRGSSQEAFNSATIAGARAVRMDGIIGSIKEGKLADLVIFDAAGSPGMSCVAESDPLTAIVRHSDVRDIEAVLIDGVWRKQRGKLSQVTVEATHDRMDWYAVREKLLQSRREIRERQRGLNFEKAKQALIAMFRIDQSKLIS